jgi:hypothetical protein
MYSHVVPIDAYEEPSHSHEVPILSQRDIDRLVQARELFTGTSNQSVDLYIRDLEFWLRQKQILFDAMAPHLAQFLSAVKSRVYLEWVSRYQRTHGISGNLNWEEATFGLRECFRHPHEVLEWSNRLHSFKRLPKESLDAYMDRLENLAYCFRSTGEAITPFAINRAFLCGLSVELQRALRASIRDFRSLSLPELAAEARYYESSFLEIALTTQVPQSRSTRDAPMMHMDSHIPPLRLEKRLSPEVKRSESSRSEDDSPSGYRSLMKRTEHPSSAEEALRLVAKILKKGVSSEKGTKSRRSQAPGTCLTCGYRHLPECKWFLRADGFLDLKDPEDKPPNYEAMVRDGPPRPKVPARGKRQESLNFQGQPRPGQRRF